MPNGQLPSHKRRFVVDILVNMVPTMEGSVITGKVKKINVTDIKLMGKDMYSDEKEITLTAE